MREEEFRIAAIEEAASDLGSLFSFLRGSGCFWHRTSLQSFEAIMASGAIEPNLGQFPTTYAQSASSYGRSIGAVCLFDFDTASSDDVLYEACKWQPFLVDQGAATIWIQIDRHLLAADKVVPAGDVLDFKLMQIPVVECWYRGRIERAAFTAYLVIRGSLAEDYRLISDENGGLEAVKEVADEWVAADQEERVRRQLSGEMSLEDIVYASMRKQEEE